MILHWRILQNLLKKIVKHKGGVKTPIKTNTMKTTTGLTIIHDGNRVNVYTPKEMVSLRDKKDLMSDVIVGLTLSGLLITIGILIGISI